MVDEDDDYRRFKRPRVDVLAAQENDERADDEFGQLFARLEAVLGDKAFQIPPLPKIATTLNRMASDPNAGLSEVSRLIERDVQMSARVMRVACSPAYSARQAPRNLRDAVLRIGLNGIRNIAMFVSLDGAFRGGRLKTPMNLEYRHAFAVACASSATGDRVGVDAHEAFLCGLMHDVGRVAILAALARLGRKKTEWTDPRFVLAALDRYHAQAGVQVLSRWELPVQAIQVAEHHHSPSAADEESRVMTRLISVVDEADKVCGEDIDAQVEQLATHSCYQDLGLTVEDLPGIFEAIETAHLDVGLLLMTS